jgi:hypothetical protein
MNNNLDRPRNYDAVLGTQAPPPVEGAVLGGLAGVKSRLASPLVKVRVAALSDALNYGETGLDLVIEALKDSSKQVRRAAYLLLRQSVKSQVKQALQHYKPWNLVERLGIYEHPPHVTSFANRIVEQFDPRMGITAPARIAYALRVEWDEYDVDITDKLEPLLQDPRANQLEALVIGAWIQNMYQCNSNIVVNALVAAKEQLTNLKAVFIGDIISMESEISWIGQSDISPLLEAYPNLELLQVRGGQGLAFSPLRHDNLEALIIETGGLSRETIAQICSLELPALNHFELWLGSDYYGGNSSVADLKPIFNDLVFPDLSYLGLRNSEYSDEIADAAMYSLLIDRIKVLDLSMGNLSDYGALTLLNYCPPVNQLDILNVSANYLSQDTIARLSELDVQLIATHQKSNYDCSDEGDRYCSVSE